jgi:DNA repair exonuclease SbcCD ATPase subunit
MNSVALAICFALTESLPLKIGFLMLDDPSQSLDESHKESLAKILSELSDKKQIVVATQDDDLLDLIRSFQPDTAAIEFRSWSVDGAQIATR